MCRITCSLNVSRAPFVREVFKLRAVRFGINQAEPEWRGEPRPGCAVNLLVQLLDAMLDARLQGGGWQVFPVLIAGGLDAGCRLGATMHEASCLGLEKRARVGLCERVARGAKSITSDRICGPVVDGAPSGVRQSRRTSQRLSDRNRLKPRDMHVDEMRVRAALPAHRACAAIFRRMFIVDFDEALVGGFHALKARERFPDSYSSAHGCKRS